MAKYQILKAIANRDTDVLSVKVLVTDTGKELHVQGWVSATKNMTRAEMKAYVLSLVKAVDNPPAIDATPTQDGAITDLTDYVA